MNSHYINNNSNNNNNNIYNNNDNNIYTDSQDIINEDSNKKTWNNSINPAYYSFPTFANSNNNTNNNNLNLGYVNDINNLVNQNGNALDSYYNPSALSRGSSLHSKDEVYIQSDNQISSAAASGSFYCNVRSSKSINNFNHYINNKVTSIKEFTRKSISQIYNCKNSLSSFSISSSNANMEEDDSRLLLNNNITNYENNNLSDNDETANITIIPTANIYMSPDGSTPSYNMPVEIINNNNHNSIDNAHHEIYRYKRKKHILDRKNLSESLVNFQNILFNSDQYLPEYDFLIELLSIPNDNLIVKHAIQHRIAYLQEYIDETQRYTQLSRISKLKKSILIQAVSFGLTLLILFNTSFFIDESNKNIHIEQKVLILKVLGIILLFYNELIFVQNSLLSVHNIAIGNIDIIFGNRNNTQLNNININSNSVTNINNNATKNYKGNKENQSMALPLNETLYDKRNYGSIDNCNINNFNTKDDIIYSTVINSNQEKISEKDYLTQEKAFYSRNNISSEKLNFSILSINEENGNNDNNNTSNKNNNNIKSSEFNSFPSFRNNIDNPMTIKKSVNNITNTKYDITSPNESITAATNKKINHYIDGNLFDSDIENVKKLYNIPNNRSNHHHNTNEHLSHIIDNCNSNNIPDGTIEENPSMIKKMYKKIMNYFNNLYNKFINLSLVNGFINNKNNYFEEIKNIFFISMSQGLIWGLLFSFIGFFYSDKQTTYSILILFSFIFSSIVMALISSINPVIVKITKVSDPIFVVGPFEIFIQIYLSILTYKIGMSLL
ncbi:hypothetical protein BCR36DRAFT_351294 [Piromyces finnis]|uniref:Uncharacterized protein n=1 Tax=Piromyces finnis TaxID=1754191 RepID=A0A1Y1VAU4_9FUNG|nr:hypothetical protein BCR36DRAFT_351294 [Piromyces finnis]|eukprot:ORX51474.1 hypothetical protein BCR36DRAFT_351294 [Piromyces finnis]